ncbi:MAG: TetR/AcrR family transcriptional regulator [Pseudomonadota bacterium]
MSSPTNQPDNRQRIAHAAERIIREHGVGGLTMRRLADAANVALKTPYNLYGSKTAVLIALLETATAPLIADLDGEEGGSMLLKLIDILHKTGETFAADESYFRDIFWEVMTSDHPEARAAAHGRITQLVILRVAMAKEAGEVQAAINSETFGGQLGLNLLATMGSWAGGHLGIVEAMNHTRVVWASLIRDVVTPSASVVIDEVLTDAQMTLSERG